MSSIIMPNAIIRGSATSCCFRVERTSAATVLFNAASDWAASCVIIIRRQHKMPHASFLTIRGPVSATCLSTQAMLVPPVVDATSWPFLMTAGATQLLNAQNGRRI